MGKGEKEDLTWAPAPGGRREVKMKRDFSVSGTIQSAQSSLTLHI